jgi:hypothetical protein
MTELKVHIVRSVQVAIMSLELLLPLHLHHRRPQPGRHLTPARQPFLMSALTTPELLSRLPEMSS